jgi:hypothetical protein
MPEVTAGDTQGSIESFGIVDCEWLIGKVLGLRLRYGRRDAGGRETRPDGRELFERSAVPIHLPVLRLLAMFESVGVWERTIQIVKASILSINYYNSFDRVDIVAGGERR